MTITIETALRENYCMQHLQEVNRQIFYLNGGDQHNRGIYNYQIQLLTKVIQEYNFN